MKTFNPDIANGKWIIKWDHDIERAISVNVDCDSPIWTIATPGGLGSVISNENMKAISAIPEMLRVINLLRELDSVYEEDKKDINRAVHCAAKVREALKMLHERHGES